MKVRLSESETELSSLDSSRVDILEHVKYDLKIFLCHVMVFGDKFSKVIGVGAQPVFADGAITIVLGIGK